MRERHLRVVGDDELPRTIVEYLGRNDDINLAKRLGGQAHWLWAADAYGIVTSGSTEADVVHCDVGSYVPVEYVAMRRLTKVEEIHDWTQRVDEVTLPSRAVAVFRVRDEALVETEWLERSPDGVADYAEVAVATDAPITLIDDEYFHWMSRIAHPAFSRLTIVK